MAVKYNGVRLDAVPAFCPGVILHKIDPLLTIRYRLMLVSVPLRHFHVFVICQIQQNIQLIVKVVEDDSSRMCLANIQHCICPARIGVHKLAQQITELAGSFDWSVLIRIPPRFVNIFVFQPVKVHIHCLMVLHGMPLEVHIHKYSVPQSHESARVQISVDLRVLREPCIDYMFVFELRAVLKKAICNEHRNIIHPAVTRSSTQQYPVVRLRYFLE